MPDTPAMRAVIWMPVTQRERPAPATIRASRAMADFALQAAQEHTGLALRHDSPGLRRPLRCKVTVDYSFESGGSGSITFSLVDADAEEAGNRGKTEI